MCDFKSVSFGRITRWLRSSVVKKIDMLGGTSYFYIKYENDASFLIIGKDAQHFYFDKTLWNQVCKRIDSLSVEERCNANKYANSSDDWKCPNRVYSPNVPAICKQYYKEKTYRINQ